MHLHFFLTLLAAASLAEARSPCKLAPPKATTEEVTDETTTTTPSTPPTTTVDPNLPCMAVWDKMMPDDSSFSEYALSSGMSDSVEECGKTCLEDEKCAYSYHGSGKCFLFEKFNPLDFSKNKQGAMVFKLYLNGTGTCDTVSLPEMTNSKQKMYYPTGGSYWLFNNVMDLVSYASYNPALGYKRRKRSILEWFFNYS